jgi:Flp pilus assembly protein TadG
MLLTNMESRHPRAARVSKPCSRRRRSRREAGTAFVEAALIFGIFIFMLIGIFDFSQFLFVHQALVERARLAARWGSVASPIDLTAVQNMVLYNQPTAPSGASPYFGLASSNVQISTACSGSDDYRLVVKISNYSYAILSPYIAGTYTGPNITVVSPLGQ